MKLDTFEAALRTSPWQLKLLVDDLRPSPNAWWPVPAALEYFWVRVFLGKRAIFRVAASTT